jgi:Na+/proline symporter
MNIDYIIIASYLAILLVIGITSGFKVNSVADYAVAKRSYNTFFLAITFLASSFGSGAVVGDVEKVATDGIIFTVAISGFLICCLIMAHYVADNFDKRFSNMLSAGDIMLHFYGRKAEKVTALAGLITSSLYIGGQLTAMGHLIGSFLGISYQTITSSAITIIIAYSAFGGMKSVAIADVLKFCTILFMVPIMTYTIVKNAGGLELVLTNLKPGALLILDHPKLYEYSMLFIACATPFMWLYPPIIQRLLMARHPGQIKTIYHVQLLVRIGFMIMIACIAFAGLASFPNTPPKHLVATMINSGLPTICRGLFVVCVLAASMSTCDSHLNAASILLSHNLFKLKNAKKELGMLRISTVTIGIFANLVAASQMDIVKLILTAFSIWGSAVTIPLLVGIMKYPTNKGAFWGCLLTSTVAIALTINKSAGFYIPILAMSSGVFGFISGLILYNKANVK